MWTISAEAMSPLITAYDCKILELQDALKSQTAQLEVLNDHCQEIVAENEKLRDNQLENLKNSSKDRRAAGAASGLEPFAPINSEMMAEMNERLDILMSENALLLEQKNLLRGELEKYQGDLAKRTAEMQDISSKHKAYGKEMKNLKDLLEQTEGDRDDIGAKLLRQGETMGKMEAERESLMNDYVHIQKSNKKAEKTIEDLSKQMKGLVMKSDEESVAYMRRTKTAETRVRELHIQLQKTTAELHISQDNSRKLRREYQATRADAEGMLQVLSGLERQIADFTSRESDFEKRMKENREALEVALAAKDQALAREEHSRREIERLLIERKKTALDRQKDVDQATELSLGRSQVYIKTVEKNLEELTLTNTQLKADTELALKENRGDKANIENYSKLLDEQRKATFDDIKQLSDKLTAVTVAKEEELRRRIEVQEFNKEMRTTIDKMMMLNSSVLVVSLVHLLRLMVLLSPCLTGTAMTFKAYYLPTLLLLSRCFVPLKLKIGFLHMYKICGGANQRNFPWMSLLSFCPPTLFPRNPSLSAPETSNAQNLSNHLLISSRDANQSLNIPQIHLKH